MLKNFQFRLTLLCNIRAYIYSELIFYICIHTHTYIPSQKFKKIARKTKLQIKKELSQNLQESRNHEVESGET